MDKAVDWISVDPARSSGVARWHGDQLIETCRIIMPRSGSGWPVWRPVLEGQTGIVLEGGFLGRGRKSSITLAERRGRIIGYADAAGVPVWGDLLQPVEWRQQVGIPSKAPRKKAKAYARGMCRWLATPPGQRPSSPMWDRFYLTTIGPSDDEREAVLIGLAWLRLSGALR